MPHSTHLSSDPEVYAGHGFPKRPDTIQASSQQAPYPSSKAAMLLTTCVGRIFLPLESKQPSPWRFNQFPIPQARENQTNKSPQLAFAAAIVAASLQLFALPGLAIEHQRNLTQEGGSNNAEIVYVQDNVRDFFAELQTELKKANHLQLLGIVLSVANLCVVLMGIPSIKNKLSEVKKENDEINKELKEMEEDRKQMTKKLLEIVEILNRS